MRSYPRPFRRPATATISDSTTAGTTGTVAACRRAPNVAGTAGLLLAEVAHG